MAAQSMIQPAGDRFRVVFPYGGQEHEVHSLQRREDADVVLHCLMTWAMADLQRSLEQTSAGGGHAMGSPQQLVQELQACVEYCRGYGEPASCWRMMEAAATKGYASVAQQLLAWDRAGALANLNADEADEMPLHLAALGGHAAVLRLLLAAAPEAASATCRYEDAELCVENWSLMHSAARGGCTAVIGALLDREPDAPSWVSAFNRTPLLEAVQAGKPAAVQLLLQAAPDMVTARTSSGRLPLHWAASNGAVAAVELLLAAAPEAATSEDNDKERPFHACLFNEWNAVEPKQYLQTARTLLPVSGLSPAQLLDALAGCVFDAQPLYADLAAHFPLSAAEWERVPMPCAGLGRALPAVLARSDAEARQLVQHLPPADQQHLRLAALCLGREQRRHRVFLPAPLVGVIMSHCLL